MDYEYNGGLTVNTIREFDYDIGSVSGVRDISHSHLQELCSSGYITSNKIIFYSSKIVKYDVNPQALTLSTVAMAAAEQVHVEFVPTKRRANTLNRPS